RARAAKALRRAAGAARPVRGDGRRRHLRGRRRLLPQAADRVSVRRYRLRVPAAEAEPALVRMLDLFPGGVEEERDGDDVILAGYADEAPADGLEPEDVEPGWEDRWRAYHRPVTVGRIWVGPPWAGDRPDADSRLVVVIDPGRAFGTGGDGAHRGR